MDTPRPPPYNLGHNTQPPELTPMSHLNIALPKIPTLIHPLAPTFLAVSTPSPIEVSILDFVSVKTLPSE